MWLRNLLLLATVVCSISAPTRSPSPVTQLCLTEAIKEARNILINSEDTNPVMNDTVAVVLEACNFEEPTCLQTHLKLFQQGLRGRLTKLRSPLTMIADYYRKACPPSPETSCVIQMTTFKHFKEKLKEFLFALPFDCWQPFEE